MCQFRSASVIALYLLLYLLYLSSSVFGGRECPPLPNKSTKNVVIKCHSESGGASFDCGESRPLGHGTVVAFDCAPFFKSNQDLSFSSKREISCINGKWLGFQYFQSFACLPECGKISKSNLASRPAQSSSQLRLPWEVSIQSGPWNCQGTLIPSLRGNVSAILTSRECISTNFPNRVRVTIDDQEYAVKAIKTPDSEATNLAILLLQRPIQLGSTALPECLPSEDEYGGVTLVSGTMGLSGNLRMTVLGGSVEECFSEISRTADRSQFCAEVGAKVHQTPKFCSTSGRGFYAIENQLNPIYSIVGIQNGVLKRPDCNSKMGFTKIEHHMDWVTEILELEAEMEVEKVSSVTEEEIGFFMNKKGCPPIKISDQGFEIQCDSMVDCLKDYSPANTVARYSCKPHFQTFTGGSSEAKIQCRSGGSWTPLPPGFGCRLDCGNGSEGSDKAGFITEGFTSARGRWPWAGAIYVETPPHSGQFEFVCGATLISQTAIATAGHCLAIPGTSRTRQKSQIQLHFGKFLRSFDKIEAETQVREVRSIHLYPHFNPLTLDSDIAIAILNKPIKITNSVHPVCLPIYGVEIERNFGSLIGWGRLLDGSFPEEMQEARLPFVPYKTCQHSHPTFGQLVRPSTNYCAGYRNSTGACDGDSGSGIFYRDSTRVNKWVLGGLVSGGVANWKGGCSPGHYSVFTKVSNFKDWILDTLSDTNSNEH